MTTTAQYRKMAQEAESNLDWKSAVHLWKEALRVYPTTSGELAASDKDKIITAINADTTMLCEVP